jgi:hypothetical protein
MAKGQDAAHHFAAKLREVARRIKSGEANGLDIYELGAIADLMEGKNRSFQAKVIPRANRPRLGAEGVSRKLQMAEAVRDYRDEHHCKLDEAYRAVSSGFHVGPDTIEKAWKEMRSMLKLDPQQRDLLIYFKGLEARGLARVSRVKK